MTRTKPKMPEVAPFIMRDDMATPAATERALQDGLRKAQLRGDEVEAKRIEKHLQESGPTGLRFAHRQKRFDPLDTLLTNPRHKHAAQVLRSAAESISTGKPVIIEPFEPPKDPELTADDLLPPIKNPPSVPDPKNRWTKAKRTMRRTKDGQDVKVDCPPTWPPKPRKTAKGMPKQFIAEAIYTAIHHKRVGDHRTSLWRECLDTFETWRMREAIWGIIIERRSLTWACRYTDLPINGRHKRIIKLNLVAALDRVAHYLENGT